ncbi:MAG: CYTH domain-containing protein [Patescibacteria group bacterium]
MADNYEIEIKCLLGSKNSADQLLARMHQVNPQTKQIGIQKQLNHYFESGNLRDLAKNIVPVLKVKKDQLKLTKLSNQARSFSLRTRQTNGKLKLILKISIDDTSSDNGTARLEFEAPIDGVTLDELDALVLKSGFAHQAKWSRDKTDYNYLGANITISFSPGYGYVAEFEKIISDPKLANQTKTELRNIMKKLDVEELPQDRLARMFDYYNKHWREYYGTEKVFNIR